MNSPRNKFYASRQVQASTPPKVYSLRPPHESVTVFRANKVGRAVDIALAPVSIGGINVSGMTLPPEKGPIQI